MKINVRKGFEMVTTDVVVNVWSETRGQREKTRKMSVTLTYSLTPLRAQTSYVLKLTSLWYSINFNKSCIYGISKYGSSVLWEKWDCMPWETSVNW